jgi:uncharacterized membrane protein YdbT with pleckstrin-like domain
MPDIPPQSPVQPPQNYTPPPHIKPVDESLVGLFERDADEQLICQINKHPIGLFFIWLTTLLMFLVAAAVGYVVMRFAPQAGLNSDGFRTAVKAVIAAIAFMILIAGYISAWVYKRSALIVTSEKLVQLLQKNLLDRKISQLSIGDIQDVSVDQRGILSRVFRYGTVVIETAGEQSNYTFDHVPLPHEYSKEIVGAHERNLKLYGN